ncbi:MAG: response regulator [Chloroflexi bacterium]|nr:MAG: response regulator [Chloroflexota bacterium]
MSGLQEFLTPFSHLVFANRDKVIVLLAALLGWFTIQLLITRWRNERLERDLSAAKSGGSPQGGRRYAAAAPVDEGHAEGGALPPVKGGRTYARNLGTALQKAGMSGPQIYSPPTPAGWAPNTNPLQAGPPQPHPQPGMASPYATPNAPWAAPPPPAPWGFPAAAGRPMPGGPPGQVPFYQPQSAPSQPMGPAPSAMPPPFAPSLYGPPAPFGQPGLPAASSGPSASPPSMAPPGIPAMPGGMPAFGNPTAVEPAMGESPAQDGGRRGKPKRRRFNFNVLESLEKMVQQKVEPLPPTGWTPPAPSSGAPVTSPVTPAAGSPPAEASTGPWQPATPAADPTAPPRTAPAKEESLPLQFGPPAAEEPADVDAAGESEKTESVEDVSETASSEPEAHGFTPEPEAAGVRGSEPETERKPDARRSMRAMMFGEESNKGEESSRGEEPAAAETSTAEPEATSSDSTWRSEPWGRAEDGAASEEPAQTAGEEPAETTPPAELTTEPAVAEAYDAWRPTSPAESEEAVPVTSSETAEAPDAGVPETPTDENGDRPSAGTIVIIEDDHTAASYYATLFKGNGYQVEVANDGVSGVDLCTRVQPQVILLDVMMPRQNGILVLQTLRASDETKNTPVVVMSNFSEPTLIKRAIQLGALEYVIKTQVEGPALLSALPRWMNREKAFAAA